MRKILKKSVRLFSAGIIVFTFFAYVCPEVNPSSFPYFVHFGTAFSYLLVANVLLALFWAWRWERIAIYHILILIVGWSYVSSFIGFSVKKSPEPDSSITVGTHNIGYLMHQFGGKYRQRDSIFTLYKGFWEKNGTPDVLCLQEAAGKYQTLVKKKLNYPHHFKAKYTTGIFSKYPMEGGGEILLKSKGNSAIWVNLNIKGQIVRLYNIHLESNHVTQRTEDLIESGEFDESKTWKKIVGVLRQVDYHTGKRAKQAEVIREHMEACKHPFIICGDFNDTPNSFVYAEIATGLVDIFKEKGFGIGTTMSKVIPLLKIDYILHSPDLEPVSSNIIDEYFFRSLRSESEDRDIGLMRIRVAHLVDELMNFDSRCSSFLMN